MPTLHETIKLILIVISLFHDISAEILCGDTLSGNLSVGETKYFNLTLSNDSFIGFEGCQSDFDIDLIFYDGDMNELIQCDYCNDMGSDQIYCHHEWASDLLVGNTEAGNYILGITSYNDSENGEFIVQFMCNPYNQSFIVSTERNYFCAN